MTGPRAATHRSGPLQGADAELFAALRLRASRSHPYFSAALFALVPRVAHGYGTFAVDVGWRIHIDPEVMAAWSLDEATAVLIHEVQHLVRDHHRRGRQIADVNHRMWNLAADAAINDDLVADGLPLPSPVLPQHLGATSGGIEEGYYKLIAAQAQELELSPTGGLGTCGAGAGGVPSDAEIDATLDNDDDSDPVEVSEIEAEVIRRTVAADAIEAQSRGEHVPPSLITWARELTQPRVPWQRVLRSAVRHSVRAVTGEALPTYVRADRRADARPEFVFPGAVRRQALVAAVVDTSASMSSRLLDAALAEIHGICARSGAATTPVVSCDQVAHSVQRVRAAESVDLTGGGGTDMRVGIRAAAELHPRPDIIVVLTDGWTPWPAAAPRGTRLVAVILGDGGERPTGPGIISCRVPADAL